MPFVIKMKLLKIRITFAPSFAYSTTMIAPSIKIPTDRINANNTTTLIVTLKNDKIIIDIKKENGIERLTRKVFP